MDNPTSVKKAIKGSGEVKVDKIIMKNPDQTEKQNALKVRKVVLCRGTYMFGIYLQGYLALSAIICVAFYGLQKQRIHHFSY